MSDATGPTVEADGSTQPATVLEVRDLHVTFERAQGQLRKSLAVKAVDGVTFDVPSGSTTAIVGESGSGKTTVARAIVGVLRPDTGSVRLRGRDLTEMSRREQSAVRGDIQMIFQDPHGSLNPRRRIGAILIEAIRAASDVSGLEARSRMLELLELVGLNESHADVLPHQISGGQRQRVGIARALATDPTVIVCDEPLSALDVSIQAQILTLLAHLQDSLGMTYIFISHDLAVVRALSDRVAVMFGGRIVESGAVDEVFSRPLHPYTAVLLSAVPDIDATHTGSAEMFAGSEQPMPDKGEAHGCAFRDRCWLYRDLDAPDLCETTVPARPEGHAHGAACHFSDETAPRFVEMLSGPDA